LFFGVCGAKVGGDLKESLTKLLYAPVPFNSFSKSERNAMGILTTSFARKKWIQAAQD
jgi:hypothetical protein